MANDPYREPVDDSVPQAVSSAPSSAPLTGVPAQSAPQEGDAPAPDASSAAVPDGFIPPPPSTDDVSSGAPVHPEAITVMPAQGDTTKADKPLREIPLQEVPMTAGMAQAAPSPAIQKGPKHGVFEPGIIMPSPLSDDSAPRETPPAPVMQPFEQGPAVAPQQAPAAHTTAASQDIANPSRRSAIRTLQGDIANTVQKNQLSIAQIALAQKERDQEQIMPSAPEEGKDVRSFVLGAVSTLLVLAGLAVLGLVAYSLRSHFDVPFFGGNTTHISTIIPAQRVETFDISTSTRAALLSRIDAFVHEPGADPLAVRALVLQQTTTGTTTVTQTATLESFMDAIGSRAPGRLVRTLGPDMMLGAIGDDPFLLSPHNSYENAFAAMLEWEPLMQDDLPFLVRFLPVAQPPQQDAPVSTSTPAFPPATSTPPITVPGPIATTTPGDTLDASEGADELSAPVAPHASWKDIVVKNVDVRALIRDDGQTLMLYSFLRDNLLLITTRKETMSMILDILATPRFGE